MAYDEALAQRVRQALGPRPTVSERKMFGGLCFMCDGKMFLGVMQDELMVRVEPEAHGEALTRLGARVMDFTGRPMNGYLYVGAEAISAPENLRSSVDQSYAFANSLPAKSAKSASRRKTGK